MTSGNGSGDPSGNPTSPTTDSDSSDDTTADTGETSPGEGESTATTSTTTGPACEPFALWIWAGDVPEEDTTFQLTQAVDLPDFEDEPVDFLRTTVAGEGTAAFTFEVPCTDAVQIWALTWDAAGDDVSNADAYTVGVDVDPGEGQRWEYGCDNADREWRWYRVRETGKACDDGGELEPVLEAGMHHLQVSNEEPVSDEPMFNFTGITAVVVTNDPDLDPLDTYDPSL